MLIGLVENSGCLIDPDKIRFWVRSTFGLLIPALSPDIGLRCHISKIDRSIVARESGTSNIYVFIVKLLRPCTTRLKPELHALLP